MIVPPSYEYVSILINLIVRTYHFDATSICILWHDNFLLNLQQSNSENFAVILSLYKPTFVEERDIPLSRLDLLTKFEEKLTEAIEINHCESFIAFEDEISSFANSFTKSVIHSKWRSLKYKFLFVYTKDQLNVTSEFKQSFFKDMASILFVEIVNGTLFDLKTTKFVGSRKNHPEEQIFLDRYHAETGTFEFNHNLYPDKLRDLKGREVIVAAFTYPPFSILRNSTVTNVMDVKNGNEDPSERLLYEGTDAELIFHLCWLYNCTVQVDSSEEEEWGFVYQNFTANGALSLIFDKKADIEMIAIYMWPEAYSILDMTYPTSRTGVTCLVPAPRRVTSWLLPLEPFQMTLWLCICGCLILEMLALLFTRKMEKGECEEHSWTNSFKFGYISTLKLFISQGTNYVIYSSSVQVVLFSCFMIDIIISSVYNGGLASILTLPTLEEAPDTIDRAIKQKLIWTGTSLGWIYILLNTQEERMRQMLSLYRVYTAEEILAKSLTERIGIVLERTQFGALSLPPNIQKPTIDRMKMMTEDIYREYVGAYTPKAWPLMQHFNHLNLMVQSSGLMKYWEYKVVAKYFDETMQKQVRDSLHTNFDENGPVQLGMENFAGIIVIWIGGTTLSILAFVGEIFLNRWTQMKALR